MPVQTYSAGELHGALCSWYLALRFINQACTDTSTHQGSLKLVVHGRMQSLTTLVLKTSYNASHDSKTAVHSQVMPG